MEKEYNAYEWLTARQKARNASLKKEERKVEKAVVTTDEEVETAAVDEVEKTKRKRPDGSRKTLRL
jgi:hypothetical protein